MTRRSAWAPTQLLGCLERSMYHAGINQVPKAQSDIPAQIDDQESTLAGPTTRATAALQTNESEL
jgi:hypothetical protein